MSMGKSSSSTGSRPATTEDLKVQMELRRTVGKLEVPLLQRAANESEFLFLAFLDGTGQDAGNPALGNPTTIGLLSLEAYALKHDSSLRIGSSYSKGIGTQNSAVGRVLDGMLAYTWADGIKQAYTELSNQAALWIKQVPDAEIRVASVGYSRGAVQSVGLERLIDRFGISHPEELEFGRDPTGNLTVISPLPPLVPPGNVAQASVLLDPVATHMPPGYNARHPGSVISRVVIHAVDEGRRLFPLLTVNDLGITPDRRTLNVGAPGGHSNVGGGSPEPGMEIMTANVAIEVLNRLSDQPLFTKRPMPMDISTVTVHQSGGITAGFGLTMDADDERNLRERLASCKVVNPCKDSEPMDQALAARFEYRRVPLDVGEMTQIQALAEQAATRHNVLGPAVPDESPHEPEQDPAPRPQKARSTGAPDLDQLAAALEAKDDAAISLALERISQSAEVQAFKQWGRAQVAAEQRQEPVAQDTIATEAPPMRR
jgi:hypothetical protein